MRSASASVQAQQSSQAARVIATGVAKVCFAGGIGHIDQVSVRYLEAAKLGIEVSGYIPTEVEKAQAERDMKRYYRDRENTVENRSRETPAPEQAAPAAPPAPPTQEAQAQVKAPEAEQAAPASTPATAQEAPQAQSPAKAPEKAPEHVQTQQPAQQAAVQPPAPQKAPDLKEAPQARPKRPRKARPRNSAGSAMLKWLRRQWQSCWNAQKLS
ncbi:MAG: hypothetical protein LBC79_08495 [Deltaproteobacteria bacterium]|nr:hypothetical protein [Deltaproteobacteria bacterium]